MCYNTNKLFSGDIPMKMQDYICKVIDSFPRKMLQWDTDIRDPVARRFASRWEDAGGYEAFAAAINNLVEEKVLSPVKKSGLNGLSPPLALRYRKLPLQEGDYSAAKEEILSFYCSRMDLSSFLNSPQDYDRHRDVLMAIDHFLIEAENNPPAVWDTVNERSFALTGHEKFLSSHKGNQLLKRIKITLQDLCCVPAPEPFFFWANALPLLPEERAHCLVVENKDTFHSLKYLLGAGKLKTTPEIHLLIYGEGKKILNSWSFIYECLPGAAGYQFFYFGDLDPEGLGICADLISAVKAGADAAMPGQFSTEADNSSVPTVEVVPAELLYELLLATGKSRPIDSDQSRVTQERMQPFFDLCSRSLIERIASLLQDDRAVPQEALTAGMLAARGRVELCLP
jgi:hypothetical protein